MKIYQVDAFTTQMFRGNPACVCILDAPQSDEWMRSLAAEMNLSETAFYLMQANGASLRWFTPKREVSLCGHATLATSHILWQENYLRADERAEFHTQSGLLTAQKNGDWIELDFPARFIEPSDANPNLNAALGITPICTSKLSADQGDVYLLEVASENEVRTLTPDFAGLSSLGVRSVIVTTRAQTNAYDFVSRYFAPGVGVNEDPVTGSAHCYLAPYWGTKLNKFDLVGFQASARGGLVGCVWQDARVILRGQAVTVFKGELLG